MYQLFRSFLFTLSPETAHEVTTSLFRTVSALPGVSAMLQKRFSDNKPEDEVEVFGLKFPNRVGLAAGFDKQATLYRSFSKLGFGFIEIGTVTPRPQPGNPKPRMFRLKKDSALINRMGFNNDGLDRAVEQLKNRPDDLIIGGNIGKNKTTPNENAADDYVTCFEGLFPYVDYFTVNVSSPNTPDLRELQDKEPLKKLLMRLQDNNDRREKRKPILLKIAPDLSTQQLDEIIEIIEETKLDGIIATNTTIERKGLKSEKNIVNEKGGLSGKPLRERSTEIIRYLSERTKGKVPVIGVGGIDSPRAAREKLEAGADLVQVYTGLIYQGPGLVKRIVTSKEVRGFNKKKS